jgi:glutamate dehydrogenase/leucine dehydrogenase
VPVQLLTSLDGEIAFDLDPEVAPSAAGPTRISDEVTVDDVALLARAATGMLATYEVRLGGAAAGIRPRLLDTRRQTAERWREEVRSLVESRRFVPLEDADPGGTARARAVVAAAEAWLGTLDGRTVAVATLDRVGRAVVHEVTRRGALVVAVATDRGAVARPDGFAPDELDAARAEHGPSFVHQLALDVHAAREVHELRVDVLVPASAVGVLDHALAPRVQAGVVVPAHLVPCTQRGLDALRAERVAVLPDVVTAGGAVLARTSPPGLTPDERLRRIDREVGERIDAARLAKVDPIRHAALLADTFLSTWVPAEHRHELPVLAP